MSVGFELSIRPARAGDRTSILALLREVVDEGATVAYDTVEGLAGYWFDPRGHCFVADVADPTAGDEGGAAAGQGDGATVGAASTTSELAGTYVVKPNQPGRGNHIANAGYAVFAKFRGCGIGRRLAEHSLEQARTLGFRGMQFNYVVASNVGAVRLWEAVGFRVVGTVPAAFRHADGTLRGVHVMYREL